MKEITISELGAIFAETLAAVVRTVSGFSLEVLPEKEDAGFNELVGVMSLTGNKRGMVFISAARGDMRTLCSFITGTPINEVTPEDMEDCLGELVNMTAGSTKLQLNDTDFLLTLSWPFVIKGRDMSISTKNKVRVTSRTLSNGEISMGIKVVY